MDRSSVQPLPASPTLLHHVVVSHGRIKARLRHRPQQQIAVESKRGPSLGSTTDLWEDGQSRCLMCFGGLILCAFISRPGAAYWGCYIYPGSADAGSNNRDGVVVIERSLSVSPAAAGKE